MVNDPVRCGLSFASVAEFRAAFVAHGEGLCFVPYPDELDAGRAVQVDVVIADRARLELEGTVRNPDFDERGNTGVIVVLTPPSAQAVGTLNGQLDQGEVPEVFITTRAKPRTAKIIGDQVQPDAEAEALFEPGAMIDDRFRIEAHIATGGMGEVYRANHVHLKRPVALKLLRRALASDPEMWARFQREAELVSQLESVHIVRVFDFGRTEAGQPYLAMEYVEGTTLDVELEKGPLAPARAAQLLAQVCEGLGEAHALGVIHRDLKPANLIIGHKRDGAEVLKIVDFGIARLASSPTRTEKQKVTQLGMMIGTPAYIAPEQALGDDVDARTDIYALGCVGYELLTGRPPFSSPDLSKVISMHLTAAPTPPDQVRADLKAWPSLTAAVLKALSKERDKRFSSVKEFAAALTVTAPATDSDADWPPSSPSVTAPTVAKAEEAWPPDPASAPQPTPADVAAVDDFFGDAPTKPSQKAVTTAAPAKAATNTLGVPLPPALEARLLAHRKAVPEAAKRGLFVFAEILGVPQNSPAAKACQQQVLAVTAGFGGFLDLHDEDGLLLGFCAETRLPSARVALAMMAMRDAVADEAARLNQPAKLRAAIMASDLRRSSSGSLAITALERARALGGRFQAGAIVCERTTAGELGAVVDLAATASADIVQFAARRPPTRRAAGELLDRALVLETFDRRLAGLAQGVVAPLIIRGPAGSGRTALAVELAARARQRSMIATSATAFPTWKRSPLSAIVALLCSACGVPIDAKERLLKPALEALKLPAPVIEAAMVVAGVSQPQWAFTAGQVAHALRAVLRAGAGDRQVVLIFDGLEHLDELSLETFAELVLRPAAKELTVGFTNAETPHEHLANAALIDLPALDTAALTKLVQTLFGVPPGPRLLGVLTQRTLGLPALIHDWLAYLDDRGAVRTTTTAVELIDDVPELDQKALSLARLEVLPTDAARILEAAWCVGENFDAQLVAIAWPRATQLSFQQAAASRMVLPLQGRRWTFASNRVMAAVGQAASRERASMHHRLALSLVEQGKANSASVNPAEVGRHLLLAGDGVRAAALFQHAAEQAIARRAPRDAVPALKGFSDALGLTPAGAPAPTPQTMQKRVEALARAAALGLASQDAALARALVDEGLRLAKAAGLESAELSLSLARVTRSEARRARAAEALAAAEKLAATSVFKSLVDVERAETLEQEGDLMGAMVAFEAALLGAPAASALALWHGEVDLTARIEARLAALSLQQRDVATARRLFESSALRWRAAAYWPGEARALSNLGAACGVAKDLAMAQKCFAAAAEAAARSGDFLFQARALLQQAKVAKKLDPKSPLVTAIASEARRLAVTLAWEQGREDATALIGS